MTRLSTLSASVVCIAVFGSPFVALAQSTEESAKRTEAVANAKNAAKDIPAVEAAVAKDVADWDAKTPDFDRMRTPDSPAFVILGVSPTEIQRPGTPMGVATALSGFVSGSSAAIPRNLALEVAPFWLYGHPELTSKQYEEGGWANMYRTLTFSLGTKQSDRQTTDAAGMTADHSDSDLAFGLRLRLFGSGPDQGKDCATKIAALGNAAAALAAAAIIDEAEVKKLKDTYGPLSDAFAAAYHKAQSEALEAQKVKAELEPALTAAQKDLDPKCFDVTASAHGWSADLAGAADWYFADSLATASNGDLRAGAGWLTLAYAGDALTAAFMGRYGGRQLGTDWQQLLDVGVRLIYKRKAFALSGEGIGRARLSGPGPDSTYKVDLVAEYKVTGESWVSVTFGKTFDAGQGGTLFSLANLTWAFGKPKIE